VSKLRRWSRNADKRLRAAGGGQLVASTKEIKSCERANIWQRGDFPKQMEPLAFQY